MFDIKLNKYKMKKILFTLFVILCIAITNAQVPSYVPTNGLVGYWPFNGNANDESGNGNNGTVNGATLTNDRFGNASNAYEFNSGEHLISTSQVFSSPNSLSYSVWVKTNSTISGHIIGFNNGQLFHGGRWDRVISIEENNILFYTYPNSNSVTNQISISVTDNEWHNLIVTMDSQGSKIYVDGILKSTNNSQNIGEGFDGYYRFGGLSPDDLNNSLIGSYDDIGIWNRALTEEEVANLYASNSSNECSTLVINTGVLSTSPVTYTSTVNIYPNPANDQITIDCGNLDNVEGWNIKITNTLGQEVFNKPMDTQQYVIPLNTWTGQGMYFVKIINAQNEVVNIKKIVLQ